MDYGLSPFFYAILRFPTLVPFFPFPFSLPPPPMLFSDPDYPQVVMSFTYRGVRLDLDQSDDQGLTLFSVWATHSHGYAVAVPGVYSRREAIYKAKRWVDQRLKTPPPNP